MRAGSLRHLITIETSTTSADSNGFAVVSWSTFATTYASVEQMKSYDKAALAATFPGADTTIICRYVAGVTSNMRVNHGGVIYSIIGNPNNVDGRNRELVLTCESGVKTS